MPPPSQTEVFDEADLVERAKNGETEAFTELVNRYERKIYRLAKHIAQNDEDAEDVLVALGFSQFRVRHHNEIARIELPAEDFARATIHLEDEAGHELMIEASTSWAYVGAGLVVVYMLITYGVFGVFANLALFVHIAFIFAGLVLLGSTLTLPGIAGIVLTIGMAVDSNVLIYERIREENHAGRSILASLDAGFNRAFATIVDSNVTMFVAAAILYFLGSGPVRGFAVSLALGILTTIVTAVTMTRMMIAVWYHYARPTKLPI